MYPTEALLHRPYQLRGMATLPENRGEGAGNLLMAKALEILQSKSGTILWCNARTRAFPFYHRLGFREVGELFYSITVPHKVMLKLL